MTGKSSVVDRTREMEERSWWDLWNTSYRTKDDNDAISGELFARAADAINGISRHRDSRILEIACGTGTLSRMLTYSSYHGLDISPAAIEIARQKSEALSLEAGVSRPTYEAADFHEWSLPAEGFDLTVCVDAISSIRDQPIAMKKMAQSLRGGGRLILTTINRYVYDRIRRTSTVRLESGPVAHWLSRGELRSLVEGAGLTIERSETIMPRGNLGFLRLVNSPRLNEALSPRMQDFLKRMKERAGLGQYSVVVACKKG
jgi:2-polyprenyl-3-methyl-5-hydroxy-6-metoxy-1,4-benzoquinol methylase